MARLAAYIGIAIILLIGLGNTEAFWLRAIFLITLGLLMALITREVIVRLKNRNISKE